MRINPHLLLSIETCSWAYKLKSSGIPGKPNDRNFMVGAVCDELVQSWFKAGWPKEWMLQHSDEYFDQYLLKHRVVWSNISKATLSEAGVTCDRDLLRHRVHKYVPRIEQVFLRYGLAGNKNLQLQRYGRVAFPNHPEHELAGVSDFFDREKHDIYEMKVTTSKEWLNKDQLLFYIALYTAIDKVRINKVYFVAPLMTKPLIELPFDYYEVRGLLKRCLAAIQLVEAGKFEPVGKCRACFNCEFRGAECPAWASKEISVGNQHFGMRDVRF